MALSGDLKDFGLLQLLTLIQVTAKSGALTLHRSGETATLHFEGGLLTKVKLGSTQGNGLAKSLYQAGRIKQDEYQLVSSQAIPSEQAIALLLVDQEILSQEEVVEFIREKSLTDLYALVTWPDGTFQLDVNAIPPEEDILTPTELGPVLEKARGYLEEWQVLLSHIPDMEKGLRLLAEPTQKTEEIRLGRSEWRMVTALCRDASLKEVGQRLGMNELTTRQVAYRLISAGLASITEIEMENVVLPPPLPSPSAFETETPEQPKKGGGFSSLFGQRGNR